MTLNSWPCCHCLGLHRQVPPHLVYVVLEAELSFVVGRQTFYPQNCIPSPHFLVCLKEDWFHSQLHCTLWFLWSVCKLSSWLQFWDFLVFFPLPCFIVPCLVSSCKGTCMLSLERFSSRLGLLDAALTCMGTGASSPSLCCCPLPNPKCSHSSVDTGLSVVLQFSDHQMPIPCSLIFFPYMKVLPLLIRF